MIVLGMDTATTATAVALRLGEGQGTIEARDDPLGGERPGHATRLLALADDLLTEAGLEWGALGRIAVGRGPGTFTGLRIGVATARGLAQSLGIELVGVSTLGVLAEQALDAPEAGASPGVLAAVDARRGELFAAACRRDPAHVREPVAPQTLAPEDLPGFVARLDCSPQAPWLAVGDGALRFRAELEGVGMRVPEDRSPLHRVSAGVLCDMAARATPSEDELLPDYLRRPDAELALEARKGSVPVAS